MKNINIAVIGWGFMGRTHTHSYQAVPLMYKGIDFKPVLKCLCSGHMENARRGMEEAGFESCTDDWRTLLTRDDIDAVSVCTPNSMHEEMVTALMRAGKHVYVDKPLSLNLESARRIEAVRRETGAHVQLVMNNRFLPATIRAKQLIDEGRIGEITCFSGKYLHSGSVDPNKPIGWKQSLEGGVILDLASHILDLTIQMTGLPESVSAAVYNLYPSRPAKDGSRVTELSEDHAAMLLKLPSGAVGTIEAGKIATGTNDELSFEIYGTKGALRFDLMDPNWLWFFDNTVPEAPFGGERGFTRIECVGRYPAPGGSFLPPKNTVGWDRGHIHCCYTFLNRIANGGKAVCTVEEAVDLHAVMDAALKSARSGQWEKPEKTDI